MNRCRCGGVLLVHKLPDGTAITSPRCAKCMTLTAKEWDRAMGQILATGDGYRRQAEGPQKGERDRGEE